MTSKEKAKHNRLMKTYGISLEEFNYKLYLQGNKCFMRPLKVGEGRLCQDHVHVKGFKAMLPKEKRKYLRGILCFYCNTALKVLERTKDGRRNRKLLEAMVMYFKSFKLKGEVE